MADKYVRATPNATAGADAPLTADRLLDANNNEYVKTSHLMTEELSLPLSVWSNTVGAASNLTAGTTPTVRVVSFTATTQRLSTTLNVPKNWDGVTDPVLNVYQALASNVANNTTVTWQVDWRVIDPTETRLITGTNVTVTASNNTGNSATGGTNTVVKVAVTIDADASGNAISAGDLLFLDLSPDALGVPRMWVLHTGLQYVRKRK